MFMLVFFLATPLLPPTTYHSVTTHRTSIIILTHCGYLASLGTHNSVSHSPSRITFVTYTRLLLVLADTLQLRSLLPNVVRKKPHTLLLSSSQLLLSPRVILSLHCWNFVLFYFTYFLHFPELCQPRAHPPHPYWLLKPSSMQSLMCTTSSILNRRWTGLNTSFGGAYSVTFVRALKSLIILLGNLNQ